MRCTERKLFLCNNYSLLFWAFCPSFPIFGSYLSGFPEKSFLYFLFGLFVRVQAIFLRMRVFTENIFLRASLYTTILWKIFHLRPRFTSNSHSFKDLHHNNNNASDYEKAEPCFKRNRTNAQKILH